MLGDRLASAEDSTRERKVCAEVRRNYRITHASRRLPQILRAWLADLRCVFHSKISRLATLSPGMRLALASL